MLEAKINVRFYVVASIRLKVREVAEARGVPNPFVLASKTGLGYAICYRLWHEQQQRIDLKTIAALCVSLDVGASEIFEINNDV